MDSLNSVFKNGGTFVFCPVCEGDHKLLLCTEDLYEYELLTRVTEDEADLVLYTIDSSIYYVCDRPGKVGNSKKKKHGWGW